MQATLRLSPGYAGMPPKASRVAWKFPPTCQAPIGPKSVDQALCIAVAHHLADGELSRAFREIARVVKRRLIFLDPLDCPRLMSRMLWSIDRGSFPRSAEVLRKFLEESYVLEQAEVFTVLHRYFVCVATPKPV